MFHRQYDFQKAVMEAVIKTNDICLVEKWKTIRNKWPAKINEKSAFCQLMDCLAIVREFVYKYGRQGIITEKWEKYLDHCRHTILDEEVRVFFIFIWFSSEQ